MKTKLGISVAMMAAITYLLGFFSGYLALILIAGYVLLFETDEWLKKSVVKALGISLVFTLASTLIGLIPNFVNLIDSLLRIFEEEFEVEVLSNLVAFVQNVLGFCEKLLMLALAFLAAKAKTIKLPVLDDMIEKNM